MFEIKFLQFYMIKLKSLLDGIGNQNVTKKYYDDWVSNYDKTLKNTNCSFKKNLIFFIKFLQFI